MSHIHAVLREQLTEEGHPFLGEQIVRELEEAWGVRFAPGYTQNLPFMSHLWGDFRCQYRPLTFYLGIEILYLAKHYLLLLLGFRHRKFRNQNLYSFGDTATAACSKKPAPIVFLHGVGLGILPYIPLLQRMRGTGHSVIALESCHLGMRWVGRVPPDDEVVQV